MGTALASVLRQHAVSLWDIDPAKVKPEATLENTVQGADVVFLCIPSWAIRTAATECKPYLRAHAPVVSLAKGIEADTRETMDQVLAAAVPDHPAVLLGGPLLAEEIATGLPGVAVAATADAKAQALLHEAFAGTNVRLEVIHDIRGAALAGVLKNIYAIGVSMVAGLGLGDNLRGWFIRCAGEEMSQVIELLGGQAATAYSSAGLADLVTTGSSPYSRNYQVGAELAKRGHTTIISEGVKSLPSVAALLGEKKSSLRVFCMIEEVLAGSVDPRTACLALLK
jgi:glycerol-3-phosphate dehydrogenase (NAD(P)+)